MQKEENYAQLKVKELHNKQSLTNYYRSNYQEDKGSEFRSISRLKKPKLLVIYSSERSNDRS